MRLHFRLIQLVFLFDLKKGVLLIGTKFRSDMIRRCSVVAQSKYAILQRTNEVEDDGASRVACKNLPGHTFEPPLRLV